MNKITPVEGQKATTDKQSGGIKVKKEDLVAVYGTGKGKLENKKKYMVHRILANKLIQKGLATTNPPSADGEASESDKGKGGKK